MLNNQDILLCKELLEAGNPPAILPRNSCSDTKNGNLNFGHQEVVPSHTSNVIGRDIGHNPESQAAANPETDKELAESGQDTGSDAGEPTSKQVVHPVGVGGPGDTPGQLHTG